MAHSFAGVEVRELFKKPGFNGRIPAIDISPVLVARGRDLAKQEGLADRIALAISMVTANGFGSLDKLPSAPCHGRSAAGVVVTWSDDRGRCPWGCTGGGRTRRTPPAP